VRPQGCAQDEAAKLAIGLLKRVTFFFISQEISLSELPSFTSSQPNFIYGIDRPALNPHTVPKIVKMERGPTTLPAKEKQPAGPSKNGYLNEVFLIFKAHQHPFVLVEESALRWMGLRVSAEDVIITSPPPSASLA
jgi:hypothetical protein